MRLDATQGTTLVRVRSRGPRATPDTRVRQWLARRLNPQVPPAGRGYVSRLRACTLPTPCYGSHVCSRTWQVQRSSRRPALVSRDRALHPQANQLTSGPVAICGKYTGLAPGRLIPTGTHQANELPMIRSNRHRDRARPASRRPTAHSHDLTRRAAHSPSVALERRALMDQWQPCRSLVRLFPQRCEAFSSWLSWAYPSSWTNEDSRSGSGYGLHVRTPRRSPTRRGLRSPSTHTRSGTHRGELASTNPDQKVTGSLSALLPDGLPRAQAMKETMRWASCRCTSPCGSGP